MSDLHPVIYEPVSDETLANVRRGIGKYPATFSATAAMTGAILARLDEAEGRAAHYEAAALELWSKRVDQRLVLIRVRDWLEQEEDPFLAADVEELLAAIRSVVDSEAPLPDTEPGEG